MTPAVLTFAGVALVALCGLAGTLGASWISNRAAERQRVARDALDERKVDLGEFESLKEELRRQLGDLKGELAEQKQAREAAEERAAKAERRARAAEHRALEAQKTGATATRKLAKRVEQLEGAMRQAGVTIPAPLP